MKNPKISFLICTYNAPELIARCLESIKKQVYKNYEIILMDGGSDKSTLDVLERYKKEMRDVKIFNNKKRLPEGYGKGKWLGWKKCTGDFVFVVDQDNELQGKNCIGEMLRIFEKEDVFGVLCLTIVKEKDSLTNKYIALMGTDPFMAYRSLDGIKHLKKIGEEKGSYTLVTLDKKNPLITGGNCFMYKKKYLDEAGGYVQDTENIARLANLGYNKMAVSKKACTHHLAIRGFLDFIRKKKKWATAYQKKSKKSFSYMPGTGEARKALIINLFLIAAILPSCYLGIKQFIKTREKAWLLHPLLAYITAFIYFFYTFTRIIFKSN